MTFDLIFFLYVNVYVWLLTWVVDHEFLSKPEFRMRKSETRRQKFMIELTNSLQDKSPKSFVNFLQPFPPSNIKYNTLNHLLGSDTKGWGNLVCIMQLCEYMVVNNRTVKEIFLTIRSQTHHNAVIKSNIYNQNKHPFY